MHSSYALPTPICFMQCIHLVLNMLPQYASFDFFSVCYYLVPQCTYFQCTYLSQLHSSKPNTTGTSTILTTTWHPCLYHTKNHDIPARKTKPTSFNLYKRFSSFQSLGFSLHKSYVLYCLRILLTHRPKELPLVGTLQLWWIAQYATSFANCFSQGEWLFIPMKESNSYRFDLTFLLVDLVDSYWRIKLRWSFTHDPKANWDVLYDLGTSMCPFFCLKVLCGGVFM